MKGIPLAVLVVLAASPAVALPCSLKPYDLQALQKSKSGVASQEDAEKLAPDEQQKLCETRKEINKISEPKNRSSPVPEILEPTNPYLSRGEISVVKTKRAAEFSKKMMED